MRHKQARFFLLFLAFFLSGCTSLPQEASQLSAALGQQISDAKSSHLNLLHLYFHEKRRRVDEFIEQVWIPKFAKTVFKQKTINAGWNKIVKNNNKKQRLLYITGVGTLLQKKINSKRIELMEPVYKLEKLLINKLNEHYDSMSTVNSTLTVLLKSSAAVQELHNRALKKLGLDEKWSRHMDKADEIIEAITSSADSYYENQDKIDSILNKLK